MVLIQFKLTVQVIDEWTDQIRSKTGEQFQGLFILPIFRSHAVHLTILFN
jgi:uncharacterized protein Yka (UPF0111/DUF47 family)